MTKVLNIDDIRAETPYVVVVKGVEYEMKTPTVEDFIENLRDMEALAAAASLSSEIELTVRMIVRAFPKLSTETVMQWPLVAIEKLFAVIRGIDPDATAEVGAEGNDKPAS